MGGGRGGGLLLLAAWHPWVSLAMRVDALPWHTSAPGCNTVRGSSGTSTGSGYDRHHWCHGCSCNMAPCSQPGRGSVPPVLCAESSVRTRATRGNFMRLPSAFLSSFFPHMLPRAFPILPWGCGRLGAFISQSSPPNRCLILPKNRTSPLTLFHLKHFSCLFTCPFLHLSTEYKVQAARTVALPLCPQYNHWAS